MTLEAASSPVAKNRGHQRGLPNVPRQLENSAHLIPPGDEFIKSSQRAFVKRLDVTLDSQRFLAAMQPQPTPRQIALYAQVDLAFAKTVLGDSPAPLLAPMLSTRQGIATLSPELVGALIAAVPQQTGFLDSLREGIKLEIVAQAEGPTEHLLRLHKLRKKVDERINAWQAWRDGGSILRHTTGSVLQLFANTNNFPKWMELARKGDASDEQLTLLIQHISSLTSFFGQHGRVGNLAREATGLQEDDIALVGSLFVDWAANICRARVDNLGTLDQASQARRAEAKEEISSLLPPIEHLLKILSGLQRSHLSAVTDHARRAISESKDCLVVTKDYCLKMLRNIET